MNPITYKIIFAEEKDCYDLQDALSSLLPGTCWDGSRMRGTQKGWREQLGVDTLPIRDYVLTTWTGNQKEPMQLQLFKDRIQEDYNLNIAETVEKEIKYRMRKNLN